MHVELKIKVSLAELRTLDQQYMRVCEVWDRKYRELSRQEAVVRIQLEQYANDFDNEQPVLFLEALSRVRQQQADEQR